MSRKTWIVVGACLLAPAASVQALRAANVPPPSAAAVRAANPPASAASATRQGHVDPRRQVAGEAVRGQGQVLNFSSAADPSVLKNVQGP